MKKIVPMLLAGMIIATAANAQTDKGDWMVGGNLAISTATGNSQFTLQPMGAYFFSNSFAAGLNLKVNSTKIGDEKRSELAAGPFARYYFNLKNSSFKPFLHAEYTLGNLVTKVPGTKSSNTTGSFFLGAGGAYFINSNVALEAVAGFNRTKVQSQAPENGFLFRIGFQVHLLGGEVDRVRGK